MRWITGLLVVALVAGAAVVAAAGEDKPDLVVLKIEKIYRGVLWYKVVAAVKNVGAAPSSPTHLRWASYEEGYGMIIAVPALAPGQEVEVVFDSGSEPLICPGGRPSIVVTVQVYIEIDPFDRIKEANEENNTQHGVFSYRACGIRWPWPPRPWPVPPPPWPGPRPPWEEPIRPCPPYCP